MYGCETLGFEAKPVLSALDASIWPYDPCVIDKRTVVMMGLIPIIKLWVFRGLWRGRRRAPFDDDS